MLVYNRKYSFLGSFWPLWVWIACMSCNLLYAQDLSSSASNSPSDQPAQATLSTVADNTDPDHPTDADDTNNLLEMSIENLMNIEVTIASKKNEKLFETPAAVYVVTAEDIRRSGAASVPDALRMVPGVQVARINSNTWAIGVRGHNSEFSNKLLVMIDGRSIYTPLFAGVYWDMHDVMLEDIDRIEVIRGPGGTIWGANAVNGIINIVTKNAKDTQGGIITGGGGSEQQGFGALRYGGKINNDTYFRIYSKYFNRDDGPIINSTDSSDRWDTVQGGFRIDWDATESDSFTFQGDIFKGCIGQPGVVNSLFTPSTTVNYVKTSTDIGGGNLLGRWKHKFDDDSDLALQLYYDRTERLEEIIEEIRDTYDIDFQHRFIPVDNHEFVWGLGYRFTGDKTKGSWTFSIDPDDRDAQLVSGFVQDRITLIEDKLKLILGSKLEYNDYTYFEYQPSGRLLWTIDQNNTLWTSITRAVRTGSRIDHDNAQTIWSVTSGGGGMPMAIGSRGNQDFESEDLIAYEVGYRLKPSEKLFLDATTFFHRYDNLRTIETVAPQFVPTPIPHMLMLFPTDNKMDGEIYGMELSGTWNIVDSWKVNAGYSFVQLQLHADHSSSDTSSAPDREGRTPHNQVFLRSYMDLTDNLELDFGFNYVDSLASGEIPSYIRLDARLGWHITEDVEFSVVGQSLIDPRYPEFGTWRNQVTESERGVYAKLTWRF